LQLIVHSNAFVPGDDDVRWINRNRVLVREPMVCRADFCAWTI